MFEPQNPIGRIFTIFNTKLGRGWPGLRRIGPGAVGDLLWIRLVPPLPLAMLTFGGILLTYAEQHGYEGSVEVQTLTEEL
jgi:hypothetical protein